MEKSHKKTVLVIDDDPDMLYMLDKAVNNAGYSVIKCEAEASVVSGEHVTPDLYILDNEKLQFFGPVPYQLHLIAL